MYNALLQCDLKGYIKFNSKLSYQPLDKRIKSHFRGKQHAQLIQACKVRCKRARKPEVAPYCPAKEEPTGAIAPLLNPELPWDLGFNNSYIPEPLGIQTEILVKMLTQVKDNTYWHMPRSCQHCNLNNIKYTKLHEILECNRHKEKQTHIFESILTELNFVREKFYGSEHSN